MEVTSKSQINITNLEQRDELVYYCTAFITECIKMRTIQGKRVFIIDRYTNNPMLEAPGFSSTQYVTLTEAKAQIKECYHS